MKSNRGVVVLAFVVFAVLICAVCYSKEANVISIVESEYAQKTAVSGTLDIFHDNKVYNLKLIGLSPESVNRDGVIVQRGDYRDMKTGDIVHVDALLSAGDDAVLSVVEWKFVGVTSSAASEPVKKEYTDEEIKAFMSEYLAKKAKFTGTFDIYDEKKQAMLNLELGVLSPEIRKFGIVSICSLNTKDKSSGSPVVLDITVENKEGVLSVQSVRIK